MNSNGDPIPFSALNHWAYCPRRCGLIHMEGELRTVVLNLSIWMTYQKF